MLWPLILPVTITFWCLTALVAVVTVASPAFKWKPGKTFLTAASLAFIAFIPSCAGIRAIVDAKRFGVFEYNSFADVNDARVERYLPPAATSITIEQYPMGYRARFSITEADLMSYLDDLWARYGDRSAVKRGETRAMSPVDREYHDLEFGDLGWSPLEDATEYRGPIMENGAGFFVWYNPKKGIAYQRANYW